MHKLRYSRSGGWRRDGCCKNQCYKGPDCYFGFGGPNQGGFGRHGMFGGYRSFYNYILPEKTIVDIQDNINFVTIPNDEHMANEKVMAIILMTILIIYFIV